LLADTAVSLLTAPVAVCDCGLIVATFSQPCCCSFSHRFIGSCCCRHQFLTFTLLVGCCRRLIVQCCCCELRIVTPPPLLRAIAGTIDIVVVTIFAHCVVACTQSLSILSPPMDCCFLEFFNLAVMATMIPSSTTSMTTTNNKRESPMAVATVHHRQRGWMTETSSYVSTQ